MVSRSNTSKTIRRRRGGAGTINTDTGLREYMAGFHPGQYGRQAVKEMPGTKEHYARWGTFSAEGPKGGIYSPGGRSYQARYGTFGIRLDLLIQDTIHIYVEVHMDCILKI